MPDHRFSVTPRWYMALLFGIIAWLYAERAGAAGGTSYAVFCWVMVALWSLLALAQLAFRLIGVEPRAWLLTGYPQNTDNPHSR